ncbi:hypothetical protein BATDEDRAFT_93036 [Batrachochytrium dendrobatidis JAM81]|uniref:Uncharacterized protein n=1 Tax=Batrachochytrium dendrobatidis (strain JAM81 / FGSC 10211) TaxID=684364 RepID=F4PF92_BATDJ|nr:uncharacterized protein BATDEDRAFT_93036 [Batrachochytrium dendrobatidis JAM81]EGF76104.1 hypothetical protein BATDEDRAFT_93036 [Batrachochytrium dendrobatidis JAM81]|eukprot:XP_006683275.1 hypothetical protein BATDEDRAFT_93036 [Batrachochytrium dendrobatidis JAM81]
MDKSSINIPISAPLDENLHLNSSSRSTACPPSTLRWSFALRSLRSLIHKPPRVSGSVAAGLGLAREEPDTSFLAYLYSNRPSTSYQAW